MSSATVTTCPHDDTAPVDVRSPATGATVTVARICTHCLDQLPAWWGCPDCTTASSEERRLCDPYPTVHHHLTRPCPRHMEDA